MSEGPELAVCSDEGLAASLESDFSRMRAFLPFISVQLGRPIIPALFCQDAAGPSDQSLQGPTGSFSLAVGFLSKNDLAQIYHHIAMRRRVSMSYASALDLATSACVLDQVLMQ